MRGIRETVEVCTLCPALVESRQLYPWGKPTFGYGKCPSDIMFVGEAPGHKGCGTTGIPFTKDASGQLYNWCLEQLGLSMDDVYTTNIVKCCPEKNRTPTSKEIALCFQHFIGEYKAIKPKVIICLGRKAEKIIRQKLSGVKIIYLPHPAYIIRQGGRSGNLKAKEYVELIRGSLGSVKK